MTHRLERRIEALEAGSSELSPKAKAWLGWPLTEVEQTLLESSKGESIDWSKLDSSSWSAEAKIWLGMN